MSTGRSHDGRFAAGSARVNSPAELLEEFDPLQLPRDPVVIG